MKSFYIENNIELGIDEAGEQRGSGARGANQMKGIKNLKK